MRVPFLMAGPNLESRSKSVSPLEEDAESEGDGEGEDLKIEGGEACEKITAPKEGDFVRKLVDPCCAVKTFRILSMDSI